MNRKKNIIQNYEDVSKIFDLHFVESTKMHLSSINFFSLRKAFFSYHNTFILKIYSCKNKCTGLMWFLLSPLLSFSLVENLNFYFRFSAGIRVCSMDNIRWTNANAPLQTAEKLEVRRQHDLQILGIPLAEILFSV